MCSCSNIFSTRSLFSLFTITDVFYVSMLKAFYPKQPVFLHFKTHIILDLQNLFLSPMHCSFQQYHVRLTAFHLLNMDIENPAQNLSKDIVCKIEILVVSRPKVVLQNHQQCCFMQDDEVAAVTSNVPQLTADKTASLKPQPKTRTSMHKNKSATLPANAALSDAKPKPAGRLSLTLKVKRLSESCLLLLF